MPKLQVSWDHITSSGGFLDRINAIGILKKIVNGPVADTFQFRLPSETEWEYAARGGKHWKDGLLYSGNNDIDVVAWYEENSGKHAHHVARKAPNQLGLYDMSGNVWEWCQDAFIRDVKQIPTDGSPFAGTSNDRVLRGGCHHNGAVHCTVSKRYEIDRAFHDDCVGFRLALSAVR
jgi:formylglycine-generating enzyme required for sulfatase activity